MLRGVLAGVLFCASSAAAQAPDDPRMRPFIHEGLPPAPAFVFEGNVYMGRLDAWPGAPDCLWRYEDERLARPGQRAITDGSPKLHCRSFIASDIGDAVDIVMRRAGPDGAPYNWQFPEPVPHNTNIGTIQWMAWGGNCEGGFGWKVGCGNQGRVAQIFARTVGEQTAQSRAGALFLATTPLGTPGTPRPRIKIGSEGVVDFLGATNENRVVARVLEPTEENETSLWLAVVRGSAVRLQPVTVGAPDSCGEGRRCLSVPN